MQKVNVGVGWMVFLGLVCSQASAQDIPEKARKDLAQNLQGPFMVFRDEVQDDLKLTDEQKEKVEEHLREFIPDVMQFFQGLEGLKQEEREKDLKVFRQKAQAKLTAVLKGTLKEDQRKRLHQLELQQEGAFALLHGEAEIGEGPEDHGRATEAIHGGRPGHAEEDRTADQRGPVGRQPEEIRPKVMKIRKEHEDQIVALLTDAQKKQWQGDARQAVGPGRVTRPPLGVSSTPAAAICSLSSHAVSRLDGETDAPLTNHDGRTAF